MILAGGAGLNKGGSATSDAKTLNRLLSLIGGMAGEVAADTRVGHLFDTAGVTEFVMTAKWGVAEISDLSGVRIKTDA